MHCTLQTTRPKFGRCDYRLVKVNDRWSRVPTAGKSRAGGGADRGAASFPEVSFPTPMAHASEAFDSRSLIRVAGRPPCWKAGADPGSAWGGRRPRGLTQRGIGGPIPGDDGTVDGGFDAAGELQDARDAATEPRQGQASDRAEGGIRRLFNARARELAPYGRLAAPRKQPPRGAGLRLSKRAPTLPAGRPFVGTTGQHAATNPGVRSPHEGYAGTSPVIPS